MADARFVYVTYIDAPPQKVFDALTDPELTKLYWARHRNASDWKPGSRWEHQDYDDASIVDIVGEVVERDPPRRLVVTWADPKEPTKRSRVTYEVESFRTATQLTVLHEELEPDSPMLKGISMGWPIVLSSLKSLLETGKPLPGLDERWKGEA